MKYLPNDASTILEIGSGNGCFIKEVRKQEKVNFGVLN
jgi:hypothetical protein